MRSPVVEGELSGGIPYLRLGAGPPLIMTSGLSLEHANPSGLERRMTLSVLGPYTDHFTVYLVNRKRGLNPGESMSGIAGQIAAGIAELIGGPVLLHGTSTGGSVALQLAIDHPDSVQRLVLMSAACRLSERGRAMQATLAARAREVDPRQAMAEMAGQFAPRGLRTLASRLMALSEARAPEVDAADMLVVIEAEDQFDAEPDLARVVAPTMVIGGAADTFYTPELFELTAAGVQDGRAVVHPRWGHLRTISAASSNHLALGFLLA